MIEVKCDKCGSPAVGYIRIGNVPGYRQFDLCGQHLSAMSRSMERFFGVDLLGEEGLDDANEAPPPPGGPHV